MEIVSVVESHWEELKAIRLASLNESPEAFSVSYEAALNRSEPEWKARASGSHGFNLVATDQGAVNKASIVLNKLQLNLNA